MGFWNRPSPKPPKEDHRTEEVAARLESVAARLERLTKALEAQLEAEEEVDAKRSGGGSNGPQ